MQQIVGKDKEQGMAPAAPTDTTSTQSFPKRSRLVAKVGALMAAAAFAAAPKEADAGFVVNNIPTASNGLTNDGINLSVGLSTLSFSVGRVNNPLERVDDVSFLAAVTDPNRQNSAVPAWDTFAANADWYFVAKNTSTPTT